MQCKQSNGKTDYIYYPIEYPTKALSSVISFCVFRDAEGWAWLLPIDKSKFISGDNEDYNAGSTTGKIMFNVICVGF